MTPTRMAHVECRIPETFAGMRLDQAVATLLPDYSRNRIQDWIKCGELRVDGQIRRPRDRLIGGELVSGDLSPRLETPARAQNISLNIIFEDAEIVVINKAAGLVVHPAAGNADGTLFNALLYHYPDLATMPRAGIVHRLDKDTTGLLVVARTERAHASLVGQLKSRSMERHYQAVVCGVLTAGGTVDAPIGRHPVDRKRMAVVANGRPAVTHYRVVTRFGAHTRLSLKLETGRTHQIRVHMAHNRSPIFGDAVYGRRLRIPSGVAEADAEILRGFQRQALHAERLALRHPATGDRQEWHAPIPPDFSRLLAVLSHYPC